MKLSDDLHQINLFCFPFGGASFYSYKPFEKYFDEHIRMIGIDLPGHGKRMRESLLKDIDDMVEDVWESINSCLNFPYAFYGHSLGTLIAYKLTVKLVKLGKPLPQRLFMSGRAAPSINKDRDVHLLPKVEFIQKIIACYGAPEKMIQTEELIDLFEPILRADFQAVGEYRHKETEPLPVPITIMTGSYDKMITNQDALKWQEVTEWEISFKKFTGDHFFIFDHTPDICSIIQQDLGKSLSSAGTDRRNFSQ